MAVRLSISTKLFLLCSLSTFSANLIAVENNPQESQSKSKIPLEHLQNFTDTINYIKFNYVKDTSDSQLFDNAIKGMLTSLDPHSNFLDEEDFKEMMISTNGEFGGLGIEVTIDHGLIKVITPIDDTPAAKAGIKPSDYIVKIDNKHVHGMSLKDAVGMMRGKDGSVVNLVILRKNTDKPLSFDIKREVIKVASVKHKVLLEQYGYVKISQFQQQTGSNLHQALKEINTKTKNSMRGFILDLRNNPGGTLDAAIIVANTFLDKNKYKNDIIVSTKGRNKFSDSNEKIQGGDNINGIPMVVLVNEGSASASEIVAGALQDHKRAIIIGTTTFGKGSVQTLIPLQKNRGIKLTTALYYTPNGRSIQAKGIEPDIFIKQLEIKKADSMESKLSALGDIKENQLKQFIKNTQTSDKDDNSSYEKLAEQKTALSEDYQLFEAMNILKTMQLTLR